MAALQRTEYGKYVSVRNIIFLLHCPCGVHTICRSSLLNFYEFKKDHGHEYRLIGN